MSQDGLALSDEQRELGATLRRFLTDTGAARSFVDTEAVFARAVWRRMARELGIQALAVPEKFDGLGQGPLELAVVHEELGRALHPAPLLATLTATDAIVLSGDDQACADLLPAIASGDTIATIAVDGVTASHSDRGWALSGSRSFVLSGHVADLVLVFADDSLFAVAGTADGLTRTPQESLDLTRRVARLDFDRVAARLIGVEDAAGPVRAGTLDRMFTVLAAEQAGGAAACLESAVAYAGSRTQFGRPIGSFQAIAHKCVDMLQGVEFAKASARYAAAALAGDWPDAPVAARVAASYCGQAFRAAATETIQVHGGTGFTWEHDAHLYYRRAWSAQHLLGGPQDHWSAIADHIGL
jgi:alkylation response protein AidB-like acyl-CoA dehydrogenase